MRCSCCLKARPSSRKGCSAHSSTDASSGVTIVGELPALVTEIEGSAWITGEHTLCLDDDDPLKDGVGAP
jgi:proline racemase